jgi:hypothetical protein
VTQCPAPISQATRWCALDDLARELAHEGWIVRFQREPVAPGAPRGHLAVTRPSASRAEYVIARHVRHRIEVWMRTGDGIRPLGTVVDVDEVAHLLRREIRASGPVQGSRSIREKAFHQSA